MTLMTKEIETALVQSGYYPDVADFMNATVIVKYFNPTGAGTWLIVGGERADNDWILYGYSELGREWEWGTVSLNELKQCVGFLGLGIERDLYCTGKTVRELKR